jgi:hypothetical protein
MIVERIFKKDIDSIEKSDLNKIIGVPESRSVEFKTIPDNDPTLKKWQLRKIEINNKENILKSIIGFLNANDSGLLILGVSTADEVADKISGVDKNIIKQLKNEISLEDFLKDKINAIPSYLDEFKLETKIITKDNERIVVFIEVKNKSWDRIYYSGITQYAYIRKGKSTKRMPLQDTLKFIAERSYPQVYTKFEELSEPNRNAGKIYPNYGINLINKGVKPADQVHCFVLIGSDDEIDASQYGGYSASIESLDTKKHGLDDFIQSHKHIKIFQFIFPKKTIQIDRIYPFNKYSSGYVSIFEEHIEKIKEIIVLTIEDNGFVRQKFKVSKTERISLEEIKNEFNPYLTI